MELYGKIQRWIESIISDNLETVSIESKGLEDWDVDQKSNRMLFKALLCLSHTADRTKPSEKPMGKLIFDIADNICYSLTEIPDLIKYYSCLYHIIRKLILMGLYPEAKRITAWSFPSNLVRGLNSQHFDMYPKFANLWHDASLELIESLPCSVSPKIDYKVLVELFTNELKIFEVIAKERSASVLCKVLRFLAKLDAVSADLKPQGNQTHRQVVGNFLKKIEIVLINDEKYDVYQEALRFVNLTTTATIRPESVGNAPAVFTEALEILETIFRSDPELSGCISIYRNIGIMSIQPIDEARKISYWELGKIEKETMSIARNFERGKGASCSLRMIGYIIQALSEPWENCVISNDPNFLNGSVLREILGLVKLMFTVLNSTVTKSCEICTENDCRMEKNIHTVTVVSMKCLVICSKISASDLLQDIFPLVKELLEENVAAIYDMKESGCAQWSTLWNHCGINIYNLSVACYKIFYEETVFLFSLLCSCIVRFEGINAVNSKINIKNPLSYVLHRLSSVHFNHGNYREALTPCALNGLLSYRHPDSKAFRMWASIKHACPDSSNILRMTMLSCLKEDMNVISEIGADVNLSDYDLTDLCLQELRGLHEGRCNLSVSMQAALDELQTLDSGALDYAQGVHLLGYHMLNYQYNAKFPKYLKQAAKRLKEDKFPGDLHLFASATLDFYTFVMNLRKIVDQTKAEMETAKFALRATKSVANEGQPKNNDAVVPAYTKINVDEDSKLFANLQQALNKWHICIERNIMGLIEEWRLALTLRILVIVAEYSRLHRFSTLEIKAWELAYKIASHLKDSRTCVYVVGRSTSSRNVNGEWINAGNNFTKELKSSCESEAENAVAFFWIGLSNLYFENEKNEEAAEIIHRVLSLPNISPHKNIQGYLSSVETVLRNYRFCANYHDGTKYMVYMVKCLYAMLSLMEYSPQPRIGGREKQLYSSEVLFACTARMSLRMNSHLSFKEISSHIINRLKLSQASGATLRAAECLKNLCFIDLSRMQLDDCVVKLHGLEYILRTEYIEESQRTKNPETSTNEMDKPGARDPRVNDASPVLRRTVFKIPEFLTHGKCSCYKCSSVDYQHLVLSSTHIRAQLYFLQGHLSEAVQHFSGAFYLRRKMLRIDSDREMNGSNERKQHPWKDYYHTVEYVLLLLDFSRFMRELKFDNGIDIATEAVAVCEKFRLQSHPIYIAARELMLEYQFCEIFKDGDFSKFTVPDASSIDINKFTHSANSLDFSSVRTPASKHCPKKPKSIRRNKTPPLLKLTKVSMILSEDEDEERSESPKSSYQRTKVGKSYRRGKTLTRKKLQKYLEAETCGSESEEDAAGAGSGVSRLKVPPEGTKTMENGPETISEIMNKAASMFPNLSKKLTEVLDREGINDSDKIQRVIKLVEEEGKNAEDLKTDYERRGRSRASGKSRSSSKNESEAIDKLVTSFKEILVGDKKVSKISLQDERLPKSSSAAGSSMFLTLPKITFTSSLETDNKIERETLYVDKKAKKRLDLWEYSEGISDVEETAFIPKLETIHRKERVRTSDRIKRSLSQNGETDGEKLDVVNIEERKEKARISVRRRIISQKEEEETSNSGTPASLGNNKEMDKKIEHIKRQPRNLRSVKKSESDINDGTSSSLSDIIEGSQLNDSDIVPSSDLEEKATMNGLLRKYKTRTTSRIIRPRSQVNGTSSKSKTLENSNRISDPPDPEEVTEIPRRSLRASKSESRSFPRSKASDERIDSQLSLNSNPSSYQDDRKPPESNVSKDSKLPATKKQVDRRPSSGRSKPKG